MSNEKIDLTQEALREKLYDWMTKGYEPQMAIPDDLPNEITEILYCIEHLGLIAELKRCYERIDYLDTDLKLCYERIDYLESVAEEYRQERPEEYCANCYAYLDDYDGDGVTYCLCSDCEASE